MDKYNDTNTLQSVHLDRPYLRSNHDHEYRCRECGCYYETKPNGWMDTTNCSQECADAYVDYLNELTHRR